MARIISRESISSFVFVELGQVSRDEICMGGSEAPSLGGGIYHKYEASVKSGVHIYPCISSSFSSSL